MVDIPHALPQPPGPVLGRGLGEAGDRVGAGLGMDAAQGQGDTGGQSGRHFLQPEARILDPQVQMPEVGLKDCLDR